MRHRLRLFVLAGWMVIFSACTDRGEQDLQAILAWSPESLGSVEPQIRRQFDRALGHLESRLQRDVSDKEIAAAVGELAMLHHVYQNSDQALSGYLVAQGLDDSDPRWPYYRGYLLSKSGQQVEAIRAYRSALVAQEELPATRIRMAESQTRAGDLDGATQTLAGLPDAARDSARGRAALGELALAKQQPEQAVAIFEPALEQSPDSNRIRVGLGEALREVGRIEEARRVLVGAGAVTPQDAELGFPDPLLAALYENNISSQRIWEMGQIRLREGKPEEALSLFRRAASIVPDRESYRTDIGNALFQMGQPEAATSEYEAVLERNSEYLPALAGLAKALHRLGQRAEAISTYERLLEVDEAHPEIHVELGNLLRLSGDVAAVDHYQRALELDPGSSSASSWLAWLRFEKGNSSESLRVLREGLRQDPGNGWMASLEMRIRVSQAANAPDSDVLVGAADLLKGNPTAFNAETLAMVYASRGQFDRADLWQTAAVGAARDLEVDATVLEERLYSYQRGVSSPVVLDKRDTVAARVPLRRSDFEKLAIDLPYSAP